MSPGTFGYDDNFEKIIARLPDLLGVQQAQLGRCTVTQLRDVCEHFTRNISKCTRA